MTDYTEPVIGDFEISDDRHAAEPPIYEVQAYDLTGVEEFLRPDLIPMIEEIAYDYYICPELIEAMIETESRGYQYADGGACKGLMQVYVSYHTDRMERLGVTDIWDERSNILVGVDILAEYQQKYGDDLYLVLGKYNGQKNAAAGDGNEYAETIINRAYELERLHGK